MYARDWQGLEAAAMAVVCLVGCLGHGGRLETRPIPVYFYTRRGLWSSGYRMAECLLVCARLAWHARVAADGRFCAVHSPGALDADSGPYSVCGQGIGC